MIKISIECDECGEKFKEKSIADINGYMALQDGDMYVQTCPDCVEKGMTGDAVVFDSGQGQAFVIRVADLIPLKELALDDREKMQLSKYGFTRIDTDKFPMNEDKPFKEKYDEANADLCDKLRKK